MKLIEYNNESKILLAVWIKIHDDNNLIDIGEMGGLVNTISYHKKFCFSRHNIYCMMICLDDWTVIDMNVRYQSGDIILYAGI